MAEAFPSKPGLRLRFLGGCEITLLDGPVHLETAKTRALLVYLTTNPGPIARHTLMGLLWGELLETNARRNLRRALWNLRQQLAAPETPQPIRSDRETVCFDRDSAYWSDIEAFEGAVAELNHEPAPEELSRYLAHARQVAELYTGDFLAGFLVDGAAPFEEWALTERERLRLEAVRTFRHLITVCAEHDEVESAIDYAHRLLALEPWLEDGHAWLMRLLARAGRRAEALAQFEVCKQRLAEEVGVEPSQETQDLYERIRAGAFRIPASNLPAATTPFIGRARELAEISQLLSRTDCRMLTVTGLGGTGKTRLARTAAAQQLASFGQGVHYVDLSSLNTNGPDVEKGAGEVADHVATALAQSLDLTVTGARDPVRALAAYLRDKEMLVVLDGFERALEGAPLLTDLLQAAGRVKFLVTSRERLNLRGEWVYPLAGLAYGPGDGDGADNEMTRRNPMRDVRELDAAKLFVQTAQRVHLGFQVSDAETRHLVEICRLVEGLPLALELAAGWVRVLSLAQIADEIARQLDFLTGDTRDRPARQRSIRAVFDQSWRLLSKAEQTTFARLSVFRSSFRAQEAGYVTGAPMRILSALVDKSLLQRLPSGRFQLHELLRQYGHEQLGRAPGKTEAARSRHCQAYVAVLSRYEISLRESTQTGVLDVIQEDVDDILAAWQWAIARRDLRAIEAMRIGFADCFHLTASFKQGEALFHRALEDLDWMEPDGEQPRLRCKLITSRATFAIYLGRIAEARTDLEQCLALFERHGDQQEIAYNRFFLAEIARFVGETSVAKTLYERSLAGYQRIGNRSAGGFCLNGLGLVCAALGQAPQAHTHLQRSLSTFQEVGHEMGQAIAGINLGKLQIAQGDTTAARATLDAAAVLCRRIGHRWGTATCLQHLGDIARLEARHAEAQTAFQESLGILEEIGQRRATGGTLVKLAQTLIDLGAHQDARDQLTKAQAVAGELHDEGLVAEVATALALLPGRVDG
ncbi:MAG: tetratricopeptide repeat protein [Anaerolineae bacterium]|nr:tetratricopeptide repeat protein [Anaerolineae bacterium]